MYRRSDEILSGKPNPTTIIQLEKTRCEAFNASLDAREAAEAVDVNPSDPQLVRNFAESAKELTSLVDAPKILSLNAGSTSAVNYI